MENKLPSSKQKLLSIEEVTSKAANGTSSRIQKELRLALEILPRNTTNRLPSQRLLVSIKPRRPAVKTLFIADKSRFRSKKGSINTVSKLGIGDHSSYTTRRSEDDSSILTSTTGDEILRHKLSKSDTNSSTSSQTKSSSAFSTKDSRLPPTDFQNFYSKLHTAEKCCKKERSHLEHRFFKNSSISQSEVSSQGTNTGKHPLEAAECLSLLFARIKHLERRIDRQEMVFQSLEPNLSSSSSDGDSDTAMPRFASDDAHPGCSYVQNYSRIPETSAFQRRSKQMSANKANTVEHERSSERYRRDFATFDGITSRGGRQCASVHDAPKLAAERMHKIRHKLNPVRDYRLADTVHYLAQGEFAPRDDGIKLTPSREAVLSDIIYEDVCRTHWPSTRLGRRPPLPSPQSTARRELQRLVDGLLRDRVAHVERRRRRHYRIVKLNHRHESCRSAGKTGDVIVASNERERPSDDRQAARRGRDECCYRACTLSKAEATRHRPTKKTLDLDRFVLLPTLVVRTPSNVRRQKKFNQLYHKILNVHQGTSAEVIDVESKAAESSLRHNVTKKDIGLNINVNLSSSQERCHSTRKTKKDKYK